MHQSVLFIVPMLYPSSAEMAVPLGACLSCRGLSQKDYAVDVTFASRATWHAFTQTVH